MVITSSNLCFVLLFDFTPSYYHVDHKKVSIFPGCFRSLLDVRTSCCPVLRLFPLSRMATGWFPSIKRSFHSRIMAAGFDLHLYFDLSRNVYAGNIMKNSEVYCLVSVHCCFVTILKFYIFQY